MKSKAELIREINTYLPALGHVVEAVPAEAYNKEQDFFEELLEEILLVLQEGNSRAG